MFRPLKSVVSLTGLCACMLAGVGCRTYELGFRTTDTETQSLMAGVTATLSPRGQAGGRQSLGQTNQHATLVASGLRPGDVITFSAPGYQPTVIRIDIGKYYLTTAGKQAKAPIPLTDTDTLPIPLQP